MASGTVDITACPSYYPPGGTITASFTWSSAGANCPSAGGNTYCAIMVIRDPGGSNHAQYFTGSSSGSYTLNATVDEAGTWDAILQVWNGSAYQTWSDTCTVMTAQPHMTLTDGPASMNFGNVNIGGDCSASESWTIRSDGFGIAPINISIVGNHPGDFPCSGCGSFNIPSGSERTVSIRFCPTVTGSRSAILRFTCLLCSPPTQIDIPLSGTGTLPPQPPHIYCFNCPSGDFGTIPVGSESPAKTFCIANDGGGSAGANVSASISGTNADQFYISYPISSPIPYGVANCLDVKFRPTSEGAKTATLNVICSNCESGYNTVTVMLSGTGLLQTVIADLDVNASVFYSGPFEMGAMEDVALLVIKNVGTVAGILSWRCYSHPGQATETLLTEDSTSYDIPAGGSTQQVVTVRIPYESGTIPFGVKVKGETEASWPAWGALGTYQWNQRLDANTLIYGLTGAAVVIGLLWYTKKKKMW